VHLEWHEHPVNATRAEQRLPPVNSLWLWGPAEAANKYSAAIAPQVATNGYTLGSHLTNPPNPSILVLDHLSEAALAEDWGSWLAGMQMLEQDWFAPLLEALRGGRIDTVRLALGHNAQVREFSISKRALLKFWSKPSLARLAP